MMTIKTTRSLAAFCFSLILISCDRPECINTNPVFDKYTPETKEYKDELVKQLNNVDQSDVRYWFEKYVKDGEREMIYVFIQGKGLCAKGVITVKQWGRISGIRRSKGMGYRGAELQGLKLDIVQDSVTTELFYRSAMDIID